MWASSSSKFGVLYLLFEYETWLLFIHFSNLRNLPTRGLEIYKTVFRGSCTSPHHIQVIYAGIIKSKARTATEQEVLTFCRAQYRKHLGVSAPTTIRNDRPYLNYYWPDAGLERLKYSNKAICYIHAADKTYDNYVTMVEEY